MQDNFYQEAEEVQLKRKVYTISLIITFAAGILFAAQFFKRMNNSFSKGAQATVTPTAGFDILQSPTPSTKRYSYEERNFSLFIPIDWKVEEKQEGGDLQLHFNDSKDSKVMCSLQFIQQDLGQTVHDYLEKNLSEKLQQFQSTIKISPTKLEIVSIEDTTSDPYKRYSWLYVLSWVYSFECQSPQSIQEESAVLFDTFINSFAPVIVPTQEIKNEESKENTAKWETYENKAYAVTFHYPSAWQEIDRVPVEGDQQKTIATFGDESSQLYTQFLVEGGFSPDQAADTVVADREEAFNNRPIRYSVIATQVLSEEEKGFLFEYIDNIENKYIIEKWLLKDSDAYILQAISHPNDVIIYKDLLMQSLNSFRLTTQENQETPTI